MPETCNLKPSLELFVCLRGKVPFGLLGKEGSYPPQVRLVHLVDQGFRRQGVFPGRGLYTLCQVLLDEPGHRGQDAGDDTHPDTAVGLASLDEAWWAQVQFRSLA